MLSLFVLLSPRIGQGASSDRSPVVENFRKEIQPILVEYCFDCHGDGANKGKVAFDGFKSDDELVGQHDLWQAVLKNVRAGLMPPDKKPRPDKAQIERLTRWIKYDAFGLDPREPDPGRVTVRRLNREEYKNTVRDLMGFDFRAEDELPPDDTGYGFDNIGDVLSVSPLLLEKYMQAAETIAAGAVPRVPRVVQERFFAATSFDRTERFATTNKANGTSGTNGTGGIKGTNSAAQAEGDRKGKSGQAQAGREQAGKSDKRGKDRFSFYDETWLERSIPVSLGGAYRVTLEVQVFGEFDFDPGRCRVVLKDNGRPLVQQELGWQNGRKFTFPVEERWAVGDRKLTVEVHPLTPIEKKKNSLTLFVSGVKVEGPLEKEHWVRPKNFDLFFTQDPPDSRAKRRVYAREILSRFVQRAYRRPVDEKTVDRLVAIAEANYSQRGRRFEDGIAQAMIRVLASPRFLFRVEDVVRFDDGRTHLASLIDEYSLASRLSYFLWSTLPDGELVRLAEKGELRQNLRAQVTRMLADKRSRELVDNFVGQWLQVRDVDGIDINSQVVLSRDTAQDRELQRSRQRFFELRNTPDEKLTEDQKKELESLRANFRKRFGEKPQVELDRDLRRALREESELAFSHVMKQDRSVLELLESRYTFLNERLAKHYGLTNLGITGAEMRLVNLPAESVRGGILSQGAVLIVTSNPTRTSPVKRGLFILDNLLGTPPPPPPPNVPPLEQSEKEGGDHTPTLRETLAIHRENALCRSCHNRMDPLGLALENFNALGMWREKERGQPIDSAGTLITGESFHDVREVKRILATERHLDFYRCLTEKFLTYALGRGLTYTDVETVDRIVDALEQSGGKFSALLMGVIESAPFQKRRDNPLTNAESANPERTKTVTPTRAAL